MYIVISDKKDQDYIQTINVQAFYYANNIQRGALLAAEIYSIVFIIESQNKMIFMLSDDPNMEEVYL